MEDTQKYTQMLLHEDSVLHLNCKDFATFWHQDRANSQVHGNSQVCCPSHALMNTSLVQSSPCWEQAQGSFLVQAAAMVIKLNLQCGRARLLG